MNDYSLLDDFEYSGNWWLPGGLEDAVGGTVSFQQGRIELEVHKPLSVGGSTLAEEELQLPIILGDSRGTKITLHKTREMLRNPGGSSFYSAEFLLIGRHFDSAEVELSSLFVRYTYLEEWIGKAPFEVDHHGGTNGEGSITYSPPEPVELESPEKGFHLRLEHSSKRNFGDFRAIKWEHHAWIKIIAQHDEALDWYSDILFSLSRLLSLLVGKPVIPVELNGLPPSEGELTEGGSAQREVDVFFDGFVRPSIDEQQNTPPFFRTLVPLPDLEANMSQVLDAWFAREEVLRPVHNLYLATLGSTKMYVEFEFLALTQALEAFHRRMLPPGKYLNDEEWTKYREVLVAAIPEAISADHKSSLKNRLKYGHEYSLRKRLRELLSSVGAIVEPHIAEDSNAFIEGVVRTRNALTHQEGDPQSLAADVVALREATRRLRRLLAALLWQELGVDNTIIQNGVRRIPIDPRLPY